MRVRRLVLAALSLCACLAVNADDAPLQTLAGQIADGDHKGVTGMMVSMHGRVAAEVYAPGKGPDTRHDIRSATKSITALLIGILRDEGRLKGIKTRFDDILPDSFAHMPPDDARRDIRLVDALTMRTGLACNDWSPASLGHEDKMYKTKDWGRFLLSQPLAYEIGRHFSYCTGGVVLLGRVIETLSGEPVPEFAEARLFAPLGIDGARWEKTPAGHTDTGGHLRLSLGALHRIGQLVLAEGRWQDRTVVSADWVETMLKERTRVPGRGSTYGYLWWRNTIPHNGRTYETVYAHGNGGTFIFVLPEAGIVAAFTGTNFNNAKRQFQPAEWLYSTIVPALVGKQDQP